MGKKIETILDIILSVVITIFLLIGVSYMTTPNNNIISIASLLIYIFIITVFVYRGLFQNSYLKKENSSLEEKISSLEEEISSLEDQVDLLTEDILDKIK